MSKPSITRLVLVSLLLMNLGFAVAVGCLLVRAWDSYASAERGVALARMDRVLFDAIVTIRSRISIEQTALLSDDDPIPVIQEVRRQASTSYERALDALSSSGLADAEALREGVRGAWGKIDSSVIDAEMRKPRGQRTLAGQEPWREAVLGAAGAVSRASISAGNAVRMVDPVAAEMVQVRRVAWTVRDAYGDQCSLLRPNVAGNTPPDPARLAAWQAKVGAYTAAWRGLDEFLARSGVPAVLSDAMRRARAATEEAQKRIDGVVAGLGVPGKAPMAGSEWTSMCNAPFYPILYLGYQALDEAIAHTVDSRSRALKSLGIYAAGLVLAVVLNGWILVMTLRRLARPIRTINESVGRLIGQEYSVPVPPTGFADELGTIAHALEGLRVNVAEAENLRRAQEENRQMLQQLSEKLSKYLSPQVCHSLLTGTKGTDLVTQRKKLTIFFSDIKDFTKTTEDMQPEDLSYLLNSYFTEMSKIALQYGATIDKFIGDAMLMFFGDPETKGVQQDAESCVRMAVAMQRRMRKLQSTWRFRGYQKPFHMRIGINTGFCNVGNFGSEDRMEYTIIGSEVNLAARLEAQAEPDGILLSSDTYALVRDIVEVKEMPPMRVKGIEGEIQTYAVTDIYAEELGRPDLIRSEFKGLRIIADLETISTEDRGAIVESVEQLLARLRAETAA